MSARLRWRNARASSWLMRRSHGSERSTSASFSTARRPASWRCQLLAAAAVSWPAASVRMASARSCPSPSWASRRPWSSVLASSLERKPRFALCKFPRMAEPTCGSSRPLSASESSAKLALAGTSCATGAPVSLETGPCCLRGGGVWRSASNNPPSQPGSSARIRLSNGGWVAKPNFRKSLLAKNRCRASEAPDD